MSIPVRLSSGFLSVKLSPALLAQKSERKKHDPAKAADDRDALEQAARRIWQDSVHIERRDRGSRNIEQSHSRTCDTGVECPTRPIGTIHKALFQHKAECRQTAEEDGDGESMNHSMQTVGRRYTWGIAESRVDWEDGCNDEEHAAQQGQTRSTKRSFPRLQ